MFAAGLCKLWYLGHQVRRHEREDVEKRARAEVVVAVGARIPPESSLLASAASAARRRLDVVPFGIRALEMGVEIEGVWVCPSARPRPESADGRQEDGRLQDSAPEGAQNMEDNDEENRAFDRSGRRPPPRQPRTPYLAHRLRLGRSRSGSLVAITPLVSAVTPGPAGP